MPSEIPQNCCQKELRDIEDLISSACSWKRSRELRTHPPVLRARRSTDQRSSSANDDFTGRVTWWAAGRSLIHTSDPEEVKVYTVTKERRSRARPTQRKGVHEGRSHHLRNVIGITLWNYFLGTFPFLPRNGKRILRLHQWRCTFAECLPRVCSPRGGFAPNKNPWRETIVSARENRLFRSDDTQRNAPFRIAFLAKGKIPPVLREHVKIPFLEKIFLLSTNINKENYLRHQDDFVRVWFCY